MPQTTLSPEDLQPILHLDAVLALAEITPALVTDLARCEPHGAGNPTPLFCAQAVQLASPVRRLGQQGQHARFRVTQDGATLNVVAFHQAEQVLALPPGPSSTSPLHPPSIPGASSRSSNSTCGLSGHMPLCHLGKAIDRLVLIAYSALELLEMYGRCLSPRGTHISPP